MIKVYYILFAVLLSSKCFSCNALEYEKIFSYDDVIDTLDSSCLNCNNAEYKIFLKLHLEKVDNEIDSSVEFLIHDNVRLKEFNYLKKYFGLISREVCLINFISLSRLIRTYTVKEYSNCFKGGTQYGIAYGMQYLSVSYEMLKFLNLEYSEKKIDFYLKLVR